MMSDKDVEQGHGFHKDKAYKATTPSYASGSIREPNYEETTIVHQAYYRRVIESFKRDPLLKITPNGVIGRMDMFFILKRRLRILRILLWLGN